MSEKISSIFRSLREAVIGTQQDFTSGSIGRAIFLLAVPMVLEMGMESLFAIVDVFYVSKLGADAVATVGLTESTLTLIYAMALGLSMSTTAMVARRIGEKDQPGAAVAAVQAIGIGLLISAPVSAVGMYYARDILRLMGASENIIAAHSGYFMWMFGGNLTIQLLFINNAIFRGAGDAVHAMRALWLANLLNIVLDPCFIFGLGPFPEMGVTGAAVATNIGRGIGVLYQLSVLIKGTRRLKICREQWRFHREVMLRLLRVSLGGMFQFFVATASWVGLTRIVSLSGSAAVAGYTIALRIITFTILPSWGVGNAAATLVGQNLGAGQPERAERSVWITGFCNLIFLGVIALAFIFFPEYFVKIFTKDPAVVPYAVDCLRYVSYGYGFYAYGMIMVQAFNGAGDTFTPTIINLFCYWLLQIPLAYTLAKPFGMGATGAFLAITIAESLLAVVSILVFRRGHWKERKI